MKDRKPRWRGTPRVPFMLLLLFIMNSTTSRANGADFYGGWADLFSRFYDPNTGLTVFPTLMVPMGGRYEGMGTAYTAIALDSGYIEANPSASSLLKNTELAFFHHGWIADSNLEGVVYTVRFNDLGIGFGGKFLYVPFTAYNEWGVSGAKDYITETVATLNVSYNFFSSYYFYGLALGANLKTAYRSIPALFAPDQSAFAFMTDLGLQTSFNLLKFYRSQAKNFSIGAVVKNLGISTLADEQLPLLATAGIAYSPLRPWIISIDYNLPFSLSPAVPAERWNLAVGTNVTMTDFISIQGGVLVKADNPRISLGTTLDLGTLSLVVNYNLDLSGQLNPLDKFSVQARLNLGDLGRMALANQAEQYYALGIQEFTKRNYASALEYLKKALELDPKNQPAADYIKIVQRALALQTEMQELHTR